MPPPPAEPASPASIGREQLANGLMQIVSERTGYPPEMLGLDIDIESELSIDSIKRVEILGALQRTLLPVHRHATQAAMGSSRRSGPSAASSTRCWKCSSQTAPPSRRRLASQRP